MTDRSTVDDGPHLRGVRAVVVRGQRSTSSLSTRSSIAITRSAHDAPVLPVDLPREHPGVVLVLGELPIVRLVLVQQCASRDRTARLTPEVAEHSAFRVDLRRAVPQVMVDAEGPRGAAGAAQRPATLAHGHCSTCSSRLRTSRTTARPRLWLTGKRRCHRSITRRQLLATRRGVRRRTSGRSRVGLPALVCGQARQLRVAPGRWLVTTVVDTTVRPTWSKRRTCDIGRPAVVVSTVHPPR
jgi:hypothetical protein